MTDCTCGHPSSQHTRWNGKAGAGLIERAEAEERQDRIKARAKRKGKVAARRSA